MDNQQITEALLELARGLEFLDDNPFKVKAYRKAAQSISSLDVPVRELIEKGEISRIEGVGKAIEAKLYAWVQEGDFSSLEKIRVKLPEGLDELLKVQGLGMKRIKLLHDKLGISTNDDLLQACDEGSLSGIKGFSEKSVRKLKRAIEKVLQYRGKYLIDTALFHARTLLEMLGTSGLKVELSGECRRGMDVISEIDLLVENNYRTRDIIQSCFQQMHLSSLRDNIIVVSCEARPTVMCHLARKEDFGVAQFLITGSAEHIRQMKDLAARSDHEIRDEGIFRGGSHIVVDEEGIYDLLGLQYIPPEIREGREIELIYAKGNAIPDLICAEHIRGTIHNHTTYSDGRSSLEEMVCTARQKGYAWLGIADHSMSAYYAGGMSVDSVRKQHMAIDDLNHGNEDFTIFKGVEADILSDGSLDYPPEVLASFDFVIASIHSHMDMDKQTMTDRIIRAIRNPLTRIFAHPTGRLLLSREPYEVDMEAVMEEAINNSVAIELNANPMRLDIDWRLIPKFTSSGGRIAICPDAHCLEGLGDMQYGIMMARKGLLSPDMCLNTLDAVDMERQLKSLWR